MSGGVWSLLRVFAALLSHWRRRPAQLAALLVGLASATALWSGVQALNAEARRSYDQAAALLGGAATDSVVAKGGGVFSREAFATLRRAGWAVSPVLEGRVVLAASDAAGAETATAPRAVRLIGVEPLSLPSEAAAAGAALETVDADGLAAFVRPPWRALAAPQTLEALGLSAGDTARLTDGGRTPPVAVAPSLAPGVLLVDIGAAEGLLGREGVISRLILDRAASRPSASIETLLGSGYRVETAGGDADLARLTDSFHLNLTAFGLLSFLVGLFIAHAAVSLAFEQRRASFRTLRALGASARMLAAALALEILAFATLAGLAGAALGGVIAAALLPDVAESLRGLYGAGVSESLTLSGGWWLSGVGMSLAGALLAAAQSLWAAYRAPIIASAGPEAWRRAEARRLATQRWAAAALLAAAAALASGVLPGRIAGFALLACLLLGAALLLPSFLVAAAAWGAAAARRPLTLWFWADGRQRVGGLSTAMAALLLALSTNIGVGAMVGGFRDAFEAWLDQRLSADLYVAVADAAEARRTADWLTSRPDVAAVLSSWRTPIRLDGGPVDLRGFQDHPIFRANWRMLSQAESHWSETAEGRGALLSEQLARRLGLGVGDPLEIDAPDGPWRLEVVGVYADYGNPRGQISVAAHALQARFPAAAPESHGVVLTNAASAATVMAALGAAFELPETSMIDQGALKAYSKNVFEQTFLVTSALNTLTLGVAGAALLASLASLSGARLAQLAPLWALGVSRRRLLALDFLKTLALALLTALAAIPLGVAVAWCLVAVVNVQAFGWRLPLSHFPQDWARLTLLALAAAAASTAPVIYRLARTPPARLAQILAQER